MDGPKKDWEDDWQQELRSHLELRADHGSTPTEARRRFGNQLQISEAIRAIHIPVFLDQLLQDLRYALRSFGRSKAFTITALLTLALGIGATSAVFSVVDRILFRDLPYPYQQRLVSIGMAAPNAANEFLLSSDYFAWQKRQTVFESLTATRGISNCDLTVNDPLRLRCVPVAWNFLATLGLRPIVGRDFAATDDEPGSPAVALLSYSLWNSRFGKSTNVLGQTIELNREPLRIIGVLPQDFEFPNLQPIDILQTMRLRPPQMQPGQRQTGPEFYLTAYARLHPGQTIAQAKDQIQPLYAEALARVPARLRNEISLRIDSLQQRQTRDSRLAAILLLCAVGILLMIACSNVANLLLARATAREREFSIRVAIGASRSRLLRQSVTESLLLSIFGTILGLAIATLLLKGFVLIAPDGLPRLAEARLDWRVLLAAVAITIACTLFFGLVPLTPGKSKWFRPALVTAQIALSTVLLSGACLFVQNLWRLTQTPLGIHTAQILTAEINLHRQRYPQRQQRQLFFDALEERLRQLPGIELVAFTDSMPPLARSMLAISSQIQVEGRPAQTTAPTGGMVVLRSVTPAYFAMLQIPLLEGRLFTEEDRAAPVGTIILSKRMAQRLFPGGSAVGHQIRVYENPYAQVVGVVADVRNAGLTGKDDPEYYELGRRHESADPSFGHVMVKSSANPTFLATALRKEVQALDPRLPIEFKTLDSKVSQLTSRQKFQSALIAGFALIGLLLAAIGLHGVIAFLVARRTGEIGLRIALGATPGNIHKLILGQAMLWTGLGLSIGLAATYLAFRYSRTMLVGVEAIDPAAIASGAAILLLVACFAAWLPSLRATRIEALAALRHD